MRLIIIVAVIVNIVFVQSEYYGFKTKMPSIVDEEAKQWLSARSIPRRWRQQYSMNQPSDEIIRTLRRLELLNENGIPQYDSQSIDGFSTETANEMVKLRRLAG